MVIRERPVSQTGAEPEDEGQRRNPWALEEHDWTGNYGNQTIPEVREYLRRLGIRTTLVDRAMKRVRGVNATARGWIVQSDPQLQDRFQRFEVIYSEEASRERGKYACGCYDEVYGEIRRKNFCSHVIAVIIARRTGLVGAYRPPRPPSQPDEPETTPAPEPAPLVAQGPQRRRPTVTRDMTPADLGFDPVKFPEFRPQQLAALARIQKTSKHTVVIQAPTGVGKTLIGAAIQRLMGTKLIYACTTKQLQEQAARDFDIVAERPFASVLKGRGNYPTQLMPFPEMTAELCQGRKLHCKLCCDGSDVLADPDRDCINFSHCSYQVARRGALSAPFPVLNVSVLLHLSAYTDMFSAMPWLVVDEADLIEQELTSFVELRIGRRWAQKLELEPPTRKTVQEAWITWVQETALPTAQARLARCAALLPKGAWDLSDYSLIKEIRWLERTILKMGEFLEALGSEPWLWYPEEWLFKPVRASSYAAELLWSKAGHRVLMSATIISIDQFCRDLGLSRRDVEFIDLPSDFPAARRPVFYRPAATITHDNQSFTIPKVLTAMDDILDSHTRDNVLVHAVSYDRARYALEHSRHRHRMITYKNASERGRILEVFRRSTKPLILVAPSMERGVDLPDELCRAVIVMKVMYPDLSDPQVKARLYGDRRHGKRGYAVQVIRSLVQATGRGMRHDKDYCLSYILDGKFEGLWREWKSLFPKWWTEALRWPQ